MNQALQQYLDLYTSQQELLCSAAPDVMNAARSSAFNILKAEGLPTHHVERYKYTDIAAILAPDYGLNLLRHAPALPAHTCAVPGLHTHTVYVAGDVVMADKKKESEAEGVEILSFTEAQQRHPQLLTNHYHHIAAQTHDALTALNTMLAQDGVLIYIREGATTELPIQLVNMAATRAAAMHNRRLLIICEAHSKASILLCDHCSTTAQTLSTQVSEVYLGQGAQLNIYSIEETNKSCNKVHNLYAWQDAESELKICDVALRAGLSRTMINVDLIGHNANTQLGGAIVASGTQHIDNNLLVNHRAIGCTSGMLYKSVLDDNSTAAFAGKVYVAEGAQKTESQQTSANLCISPTARALSQPMLEIYADDVKCNHGATVGKLDETALFYMRQRGIGEAEAKLLLQHAFVNEVISQIEIPALRDRLTTLIDQRFRGDNDAHCQGCGLCGK